MLASGFVLSEVCAEWPAAQSWFLRMPEQLAAVLGWTAGAGWIEGIWTLGVVPLCLWTVLGSLAVLRGGAKTLAEAWRRLALPMAVVVAAGHMSKGLAKFTSWVGHLPYALGTPDGVTTSLAMNAKELAKPAPVLPIGLVSSLGVALLLVGTWLALREARLADGEGHRRRALPLLVLATVYLCLVSGWRFAA
jgi:hypothetical protein